ncbi:MAG TPA: phosphotransferase [Acidimicrobiales bacterium]|nr:phosphotransferase [Acidimicrobiales bacterium]
MRILPDNPSLEFLRQEAKDLLAAMRETEPMATLSTAQRELALQYGCRSWAALRDEVERRRSTLPVAPVGLAQALADRFGLGRVESAPQPIGFEPMGRTWRLATTTGDWIARPQYSWMSDEQAERGERLRRAAADAGIASPTPRRTVDGRLVSRIDDAVWRVDEWMEVGPVATRPVAAATASAVGALLATIHQLAIPSDAPFHLYTTTRRPMSTWHELIESGRAAGKDWTEDLVALLPAIEEVRSIPDPSFDSPILGNCLIDENTIRLGHRRQLVVVEWGFAGSVTPALEFASVLTHLVFRPSINRVAARAFADGYREVAGALPALERGSFLFEIGGWFNWTWNQLRESTDPRGPDRGWLAEHEGRDSLAHPITVDAIDRLIDAVSAASAS